MGGAVESTGAMAPSTWQRSGSGNCIVPSALVVCGLAATIVAAVTMAPLVGKPIALAGISSPVSASQAACSAGARWGAAHDEAREAKLPAASAADTASSAPSRWRQRCRRSGAETLHVEATTHLPVVLARLARRPIFAEVLHGELAVAVIERLAQVHGAREQAHLAIELRIGLEHGRVDHAVGIHPAVFDLAVYGRVLDRRLPGQDIDDSVLVDPVLEGIDVIPGALQIGHHEPLADHRAQPVDAGPVDEVQLLNAGIHLLLGGQDVVDAALHPRGHQRLRR